MNHRAIIEYLSQRRCDVRSLRPKKHKGTYKMACFPHLCPNLIVSVSRGRRASLSCLKNALIIFRMARTPPRQTRPQSLRYFCPADEATTALEESKTGTWFRFNCACVKLFTHLTKKSSQGKFSLLAHCYNWLFPKQFFFLWPLVDVFGEERQVTWKDCLRRPKMYIYLNTTNEHLLVTTTYILSCSEWAQQ